MQNTYGNMPMRGSPTTMNYSTTSLPFREPSGEPPSPRFDATMQFPSSEILLGNYRPGPNGPANITPPSSTRTRASQYLNTSDPIAMHLLVETALGDSQAFEVLSFEELEELKREEQLLNIRIETVRRKLALETKIRDAAKSMNRLFSNPTTPKMSRRISGGSSKRDTLDRAEMELASSTQKCDELSRELYHLEQRSKQAREKLLKHTAGVLQMTYRQPKRRRYDMIFGSNGRPDSPASLDGWQGFDGDPNSREVSRTPDNLDGMLDDLKFDRPRGRASLNTLKNAAKQRDLLVAVGRRLEELNGRVRELIAEANPEKLVTYDPVPSMAGGGGDLDVSVAQQLDYLNDSLVALRAESRGSGSTGMAVQQRNAELQAELERNTRESMATQSLHQDLTFKLKEINSQLSDLLSDNSPNLAAIQMPPMGDGPAKQLEYTQATVNNLTTLFDSLVESVETYRNTSVMNGDRAAQYDTVIQGLWDIILAGEEEARRRKRAERDQQTQSRTAGSQANEEDELSADEDDGTNNEFSLPSFSTKVQWLVSKATTLKEKQIDLQRRVQQQREQLSRAVSPSQDPSVVKMRGDYERLNGLYAAAKDDTQKRDALLKRQDDEIKSLQAIEAKAQSLVSELEAVAQQKEDAERSMGEKDAALAKSQAELQELEGEVVRLTTELAVARAEVDAAYGSRSQRQADWAAAANTEDKRRIAELEARVADGATAAGREEALKAELAATLAEFEDLTRAAVEAEREREGLERGVDRLRDRVEALEGQLADERVKWMGIKSPGVAGAEVAVPQQGMGTAVLKNEFKKMMRDTRAEHLKALKVSIRLHVAWICLGPLLT